MLEGETKRLYEFMLKHYPVDVNSHNALLHVPSTELLPSVADIAMFIMKRLEYREEPFVSKEAYEKRCGWVHLNTLMAETMDMESGQHKCLAQGPMDFFDDSLGGSYPVYVCEFENGRVLEIACNQVQLAGTEHTAIRFGVMW